jgi:NAD(P)-dependent dehydrogenase (short-subunit alcohol dehydrogenase family)
VRVNAIAPDVTQTSQVDYESMVPEELRDRWPIWVPVGRVGTPADNADVILFLASDLSRFVTGHVIPTDGGTGAAGGWFRTAGRGRWTNRPRNP